MKKFDPLKHELVPKHTLISDKDKEELFARYKISISDLPHISKNDPAIRQLVAKQGDVIKIIRKSRSAGEAVYYRGV